ncbi:metallophosphoesterase family protein [Pleomorphovibrio marinus]|uniref:metallophosphoesterase family protein n=1 Tax=Pleomorphovibrio marinus TaxID=2164132 RepID=UPI000E0B9B31|nr:metallophosphoesterase family protein [Pleomorphovibrio marinus]
MRKIALISDSHGHVDSSILQILENVDEIWHAGDIGQPDIINSLPNGKILRVVSGNIDDNGVKMKYPETCEFVVEGLKVLMTHIGGRPGRYAKGIKQWIKAQNPDSFICGHSHICKVMFDKELGCLYMNPGAIGHQGFHQTRTMLLFEVVGGKIENLRVVELGKRGRALEKTKAL